MSRRPLRRAGAVWRLLAHRHPSGSARSDFSFHVQSDRVGGDTSDTEHSQTTVLERTELDELVVGRWMHLEQMGTGKWWMTVGGVVLWVEADRDGRPTAVSVFGPRDHDDPVEGVEYHLAWSADGDEYARPEDPPLITEVAGSFVPLKAPLGGWPDCDCGHEGQDEMFHLGLCPVAARWRERRKAARDA
jgi:hypothetical protein